ncbi:MAG: ComEC/Rec2 family competence protein, partial [Acidimicrobiales bacterium]
MTDRWAVVVAVAAASGAVAGVAFNGWVVVLAVGVALLSWRPAAFGIAVLVVCSTMAARAEAGLEPPDRHRVEGWMTMLNDPRASAGGATMVELRVGSRRVQGWARGSAASALRSRLAGEQIRVSGTVGPLAPSARERLRWRHVSARMTIDSIDGHRSGGAVARVANSFRRTFVSGARSLDRSQRSLLAGFVMGDDRDQPARLADDFRAAGLTHLLAVSGQNVAFLLLIAGPFIRRAGPAGKVVIVGGLLILFGTVTRWEPSVIRAVAMTTTALTATWRGRLAGSLRSLAVAVIGLLLIDPLLVHSVGFVLSVGACIGIATLSGPIARLLPGPRWLVLPAAVTLAAQAGVSPVLIPVFGGVPVASLPANLLAAPAAGPVMVWGLVGGLLAGLLGPPFDGLIHVPTSMLLSWVQVVARVCGTGRLGEIGFAHLFGLTVGFVLIALRPRARLLGALLIVVVLLLPALRWWVPTDLVGTEASRDVVVWREGAATVVLF